MSGKEFKYCQSSFTSNLLRIGGFKCLIWLRGWRNIFTPLPLAGRMCKAVGMEELVQQYFGRRMIDHLNTMCLF